MLSASTITEVRSDHLVFRIRSDDFSELEASMCQKLRSNSWTLINGEKISRRMMYTKAFLVNNCTRVKSTIRDGLGEEIRWVDLCMYTRSEVSIKSNKIRYSARRKKKGIEICEMLLDDHKEYNC